MKSFRGSILGILLLGASLMQADLSGLTITGTKTYTDPNEFTISNSTVELDDNLTLKAGHIVRLLPSFYTKATSPLSVRIDETPTQVVLTNLPPNTPNTRFGSQDIFSSKIVRPALSIRGFDSSTLPVGTSYGLGIKQILENYFETVPNVSIEEVVDEIISQANDDLIIPQGTLVEKRIHLDTNSRITQSRAFVALATYILEKNGYGSQSQSIFGVSHNVALDSLLSAFLNPPSGKHIGLDLVTDDNLTKTENAENIAVNLEDLDPVKFSESLANMARAIDLYLALENAYEDMGGDTNELLSQQNKQDWNTAIWNEMRIIWQETRAENDFFADLFNVNNHEVQPGNWALISFVSIGYVAVGFNGSFPLIFDDSLDSTDLDGIFALAMKSAAFHYTDSGDQRFNYWWYQTGQGKPFFAEGAYYFNIVLPRLVSFWHAVRANNMLNETSEGDGIDPFRYNNFLALG